MPLQPEDAKKVDSWLAPELREWARQQFTEAEIVAELKELREKGGLELKEFLQELEDAVARQ